MGEHATATGPDERFSRTFFVVEADSFAQHMLWLEHSAEAGTIEGTSRRGVRVPWQQHTMGLAIEVGEVCELPVIISCSWADIGGRLVLFYYPCSRIVDHEQIAEWLRDRCSPTWDGGYRRAHCDAMNFHHCLDAIAGRP